MEVFPHSLDELLGQWTDTSGSKYELYPDSPPTSLTVKTTRPNGIARITRALIRLEFSERRIVWGHTYELDLACLFGWIYRMGPKLRTGQTWIIRVSTLRWLRVGDKAHAFVWTRHDASSATNSSPGLVLPPQSVTRHGHSSTVRSRSPARTTQPASVCDSGRVPSPWEEHWCEQWGLSYYFNTDTSESVWERPETW